LNLGFPFLYQRNQKNRISTLRKGQFERPTQHTVLCISFCPRILKALSNNLRILIQLSWKQHNQLESNVSTIRIIYNYTPIGAAQAIKTGIYIAKLYPYMHKMFT